jgi:DNA uptake protein ComE-like DNA-binding protein
MVINMNNNRHLIWLLPVLVLGLFARPLQAQQAELYQEVDTISYIKSQPLDLNGAGYQQILELPGMTVGLADNIWQFLFERGQFTSFFQLADIPGITPADINRLKDQVKIVPPKGQSDVTRYIADLQDRLAAEERPGQGAINEWEELLLHPMNVNNATMDQLLILQNVTAIDAAALIKHIREQGKITSWTTLTRNVRGLSRYGYLNLRNYIAIDGGAAENYWDGNWRISLERDNELNGGTDVNYRTLSAYIRASAQNFDVINPTDTITTSWTLKKYGWSDAEVLSIKNRLWDEYRALKTAGNYGYFNQRLTANYSGRYRVGALLQSQPYEQSNLAKAYVGLSGAGLIEKAFIGNYRMTVGQGLVFDNTDENMIRQVSRGAGLFGDITNTREFALRGAALQSRLWRLSPVAFYSENYRDGIVNRDGTINTYFLVNPRFSPFRDAFKEKTYGGTVKMDLSDYYGLPVGTSLGLTGFTSSYDKPFRPDPLELDIPGDKNELSDPNYTQLWSGSNRRIWGANFSTVADNISVDGELGKLAGGGWAYVMQSRLQYETVYFLLLRRRYDVNYDNPYSRAFSEQVKFDDSILEKEYRLLDPVYQQLISYPAPKAEEGTYLETRWQMSRKFTITRAYIDFWRNLAYGLNNVRCQAEVEYRPAFPVRFRLKQKWQSKQLPKSALPTKSTTMETTLRTFCALSDRDNLNIELRYGEVHLTPSTAYGSNVIMSGAFLSSSWEHNLSATWDIKAGMATWRTDAMSQWIFVDNGIDFLEGEGLKYFVSVSDRLSDNLQVKLRVMGKNTKYSYAGIYQPESGFYYDDLPGVPVSDFTDNQERWQVGLQLDLRW